MLGEDVKGGWITVEDGGSELLDGTEIFGQVSRGHVKGGQEELVHRPVGSPERRSRLGQRNDHVAPGNRYSITFATQLASGPPILPVQGGVGHADGGRVVENLQGGARRAARVAAPQLPGRNRRGNKGIEVFLDVFAGQHRELDEIPALPDITGFQLQAIEKFPVVRNRFVGFGYESPPPFSLVGDQLVPRKPLAFLQEVAIRPESAAIPLPVQ